MQGISFFKRMSGISRKPVYQQILRLPIISLKLFIFTRLARLLKLPIEHLAITFWGQTVRGCFPDPTFSSIYLHGFSDEGLTQIILKYLRSGMIFIDVGAHLGYEALLASEIVGNKGKVISFEPTPDTYKLLYDNTKDIKNIIINSCAVWSKSMILEFFDYGPSYSGLNSFGAPRIPKKLLPTLKAESYKVPAVSLDDYCNLYKIKPDFIKLDAESAEYDILQGMKFILNAMRPIVVVEIGDMLEQKNRTRNILGFLEKCGYKPLEYTEGGFRVHEKKDSYLGVYDNLLFLPN